MVQQGDISLFQTLDGGDIEIIDGLITMSGGLETMIYLCLFGGNDQDSGLSGNIENWWGNLDEDDPARQYRSETQNLLQSLPATSGNLLRIKSAVDRDLAVFLTSKIASEVTSIVTMPGLNLVKIAITIIAFGEEQTFEHVENWKVTTL